MMKQILKEEELIGKTIISHGYSNNAFSLLFSDDTFCIFEGCGYDDLDVRFSEDEINLIPTSTSYHNWILVQLKLIDASVAEAMDLKKEREDKICQEEYDRNQYEELKKRFEG